MPADDRYRRAAAAGGVGIWDWNLATGEIYVDPILKQVLGYEDWEIGNHVDDWSNLVHPDDRAAVFARAQAVITGRTPRFETEHRMLHRDGSIRWVLARGALTRDASGAAVSLAGVDTDITERKRSEERAYEALHASEARNRAMLRAIPDWMFLTTIDGVFLDYHARDSSRLYVPPSAFLGKNISEVLPPAVGELLIRAFARVAASDEPEQVEYVLGSEESERFYEACIVRCDGDNMLSIVRDITDRKRNEIDTDAHRRELAHLSRVATLGELTGALAHELSQPLTAVRSNAQAAWHLLGREPLDQAELRAALDDIIRNNRRAGAVIDRLRALLRKESTAFQPVDVNDVVRDVIDLAHSEIVSRRIRPTSRLTSEAPIVQGDRIQLQQVLLNLVLNACDAMSESGSSQRQLVLTTEVTDGYVELAVSDGGPGIPENQLERVFEPFVTFRQQGLGLGLAISRSIVSDHGGSICAENNPAGGATFRCQLPLARVIANA
jgi:PAS domain S-box-containing protein